jgi:hypothetical protein
MIPELLNSKAKKLLASYPTLLATTGLLIHPCSSYPYANNTIVILTPNL